MWKWVTGAIGALLALVWALFGKNRQLQNEVETAKADSAFKEVKGKLYEQGKQADAATTDFKSADDEFRRALADLRESGGDDSNHRK